MFLFLPHFKLWIIHLSNITSSTIITIAIISTQKETKWQD